MSPAAPGDRRDVAPELVERVEHDRWQVERWCGSAAALHRLEWPDPVTPTVWMLEVDRPALVLGSTQDAGAVDVDALAGSGIELTSRRSGGGAVLLEPGNGLWIDVLIGRDDRRWDDDLGRSFRWLGQAWVGGLDALGIDATVHDGALACGAFGRRVCFAALGSGEVTVGGAKAVGLSQRRTRAGARFQSTCYRAWHPAPLAALDLDPDALPPVAPLDLDPHSLEQSLLHHL